MILQGTILNTLLILAGGIVGLFAGGFFREEQQSSLSKACGICVLFIAIAGAMETMLTIEDGALISGKSMLISVAIAIGTLIGEIIDIEKGFNNFGEWLKIKTGNAKDARFVDAFVTCSLTVCVGAMAIVGSIQDGVKGDYSILLLKGVLDFVIVVVMTSSMGKGCIFSAIPVFAFEGLITLFARALQPVMTDLAIEYIGLIGSILIFCVGVNLVWGKIIRVANMLPSIVVAAVFAYLPIAW